MTRMVAECFSTLLNSMSGFRAMIANLNARDYLKFIGMETKDQSLPTNNRLLIFDKSSCCQLNIRVVCSSDKKDSEDNNNRDDDNDCEIDSKISHDVYQEMVNCVTDLKQITEIIKHMEISMACIGVIACPSINRNVIG